jgi:hypothetical protein
MLLFLMREIEKNVLFLNFTLKPPVTILGKSIMRHMDKRTSGQTDYWTNGLLDKRTYNDPIFLAEP